MRSVATAVAMAGLAQACTGAPHTAPLAHIRLHNPTNWAGPSLVEVPVGQVASPGLIDWSRTRLVIDGAGLPFSIREGIPHWRARLVAPVRVPRAEDLLVFSVAVPPGRSLSIDIVPGHPGRSSHLARKGRRCLVTYPGVRAVLDGGMLASLEVGDKQVLAGALTARHLRVRYAQKARAGGFGPWTEDGTLRFEKLGAIPGMSATLVGTSSTGAMTELHYLLRAGQAPAMGLAYRIHSSGMVEVEADERPWIGKSPWVGHAIEFSLPIRGTATPLPYLENRAPMYGFRDYLAAVQFPCSVYHSASGAVVSLGEQTINGRKWTRRLVPVPVGMRPADAVEIATEGLAVQVEPVSMPAVPSIRVVAPATAHAAAAVLGPTSARPGATTVELRMVADPGRRGIAGDGYAVRGSGGRVVVEAGTLFGLTRAALRIQAARRGAGARIPLVAENPAVAPRAGGFGGGDFEVDFPYGTDAEWKRVLSCLVASGMNTMGDLGMWSNWRMPVAYRYMPELKSDAPDAYDEVSGCKFTDLEKARKQALGLARILHDRGVKVWLWLPIGAVPTTYARAHPEAMAPGSDKTPCFTHPLYTRYLEAFLRELLETYPIDGIVMIRDDNGGLCTCDRCKAQLATSRTHSAAWERCLALYDGLRRRGFRGDVAVYPYYDSYEPALEPLLPADLHIVGHGGGLSVVTRNYEVAAPMGDAWIDNFYAAFRLPSTHRMKRLLSDRGSFWIGGAYTGTELTWEAVGAFGTTPSMSVNTFRRQWAERAFGPKAGLPFVGLSQVIDRLWDLYDLPMLPTNWVKLDPGRQSGVAREARGLLDLYAARLAAMKRALPGTRAAADWHAHVSLLGPYVSCHLRRLEALAGMERIVGPYAAAGGAPTPAERAKLVALRDQVYGDADDLEKKMAAVPGNMMARTRASGLVQPFHEWAMGAYGYILERELKVKQFDGVIEAGPVELKAGEPFTLRVAVRNRGAWPWAPGVGHRLLVGGDAAKLGLAADWALPEGAAPAAFGETLTATISGRAPAPEGQGHISLGFTSPIDAAHPFIQADITVEWR